MEMDGNEIIERFGTCSKDCYGSCVFKGLWDDSKPIQKLIKAKPLPLHPFTQGFFYPKFNNREQILYHPRRLKEVLVRTGPKGRLNFQI